MLKLTEKQINRLKNQLMLDKKDLERQLELNDNYGLSGSLSEMTGEISTYDNHPADIGTEVYERGKDVALNENAEHHLEEINLALENIEIGQYGICLACGANIPYQRLEAIPTTQYCIKHVPDPHLSGRRPVEEEILQPPFGRTSLDELDEHNQFDGEDTWQIVASWGTSNTPALAENPNVEDDYDHMFIESDENEGFVEPMESFLATDIYGKNVMIVRNRQYRQYIDNNEGDHGLEVDTSFQDE